MFINTLCEFCDENCENFPLADLKCKINTARNVLASAQCRAATFQHASRSSPLCTF